MNTIPLSLNKVLMNLLHPPTSVNCPQDIISHIQVVHRLQVKSIYITSFSLIIIPVLDNACPALKLIVILLVKYS